VREFHFGESTLWAWLFNASLGYCRLEFVLRLRQPGFFQREDCFLLMPRSEIVRGADLLGPSGNFGQHHLRLESDPGLASPGRALRPPAAQCRETEERAAEQGERAGLGSGHSSRTALPAEGAHLGNVGTAD
jgi:hypothetical protein